MSQLIAQVIHTNKDTASIVQTILSRVLAKYPEQAMWSLSWLQNSKNKDRAKIGKEIFADAQKFLDNKKPKLAALLKASEGLIGYLHQVAM